MWVNYNNFTATSVERFSQDWGNNPNFFQITFVKSIVAVIVAAQHCQKPPSIRIEFHHPHARSNGG